MLEEEFLKVGFELTALKGSILPTLKNFAVDMAIMVPTGIVTLVVAEKTIPPMVDKSLRGLEWLACKLG